MRTASALLMIALAGCSPHRDTAPVEAYASLGDRIKARVAGLGWLDPPCMRGDRWLDDARCYRFGPARRWSGIIVPSDYLGSSFFPGRWALVATAPRATRFAVVGLRPVRGCRHPLCVSVGDPTSDLDAPARAYAVEFVGRRTVVEGGYGHERVFGHEIIVDRLLRAHEVTLPAR